MRPLLLLLLAAPAAAQYDYSFFDTYPLEGAYFYSVVESSAPSWAGAMSGRLPVRRRPAFTAGGSLELRYSSRPGGAWTAKLQRRPIRGQDPWDNGVFIQERPSPFKKPEVLHLRVHGVSDPEQLPEVALVLAGSTHTMTAAVPLGKFVSRPDDDGWAAARVPISEFQAPPLVAEQVVAVVLRQGSKADAREYLLHLDQVDLRPSVDPVLDARRAPSILSAKGYERHLDVAWAPETDPAVQGVLIERSRDGKDFAAVGFRPRWMSRFADYVGDDGGTYHYRLRLQGYDGSRSQPSSVLKAATRAMTDAQLLDMVQEASARYYWEGAEPETGMTLESIPGDRRMVAVGASGFGLMSLVVAADRGFLAREKVAERFEKVLAFLERADRFHGAMPHYYDGGSGKPFLFFGPDDNGGDMVETSFLMQGLLTARQFFDKPQEKALRDRITKLWESVEWSWYRQTPENPYLLWHWSPTVAFKIQHRLIGWNESMITYLLAIASPKHAVPPEMYYSGWASQAREAQQYRGDGPGKMYSSGEVIHGVRLPVGGWTGGPLFFIHYNFMGMDPRGLKDKYADYFENSKALAEINRRYCVENPLRRPGYGEDAWGLTASDAPWGYNPDEPRVEGDKGKITPTGALASMPYLPEPAMAALKNYYRKQGSFLWGEYGFRDAYSPGDHWVNDLYMGLNQGPIVVMIENHRTGRPWSLFMSNPEIAEMKKKVFAQ